MPAIEWYNKIPSSWNAGDNRTQYADVLPNVTLPLSKIWVPPRGEYTISLAKSRGVNMFNKFEIQDLATGDVPAYNALVNAGETYGAVERTEAFLGLNPVGPEDWAVAPNGTQYNKQYFPDGPLTYAQAYAKGGVSGISHRLVINETEEGPSWIRPSDPMWTGYYERYMQRMVAQHTIPGKPPMVAHNYFNYFGSAPANNGWWLLGGSTSSAIHKTEFDKPINLWGQNDFSPGTGSLRHTNLIVEGWYKGAFDLADRDLTRLMFKHLVYKKLGYYAGTVCANVREWRPNNQQGLRFKEADFPGSGNWGTFFRNQKIPYDPTITASVSFWTMVFGDVFADWGVEGKNTKTKLDHGWNNYDYWYPNQLNAIGSNTGQEAQADEHRGYTRHANSFPHYSANIYDPDKRSAGGGHNGSMFGVSQYAKTVGAVHGGAIYFPEYRINGGAWVTQDQIPAHAVADVHYSGKPLVYAQRQGGQIALAVVEERGTGIKKDIEIKHPTNTGVTYTQQIAGHGTHSALIDE